MFDQDYFMDEQKNGEMKG